MDSKFVVILLVGLVIGGGLGYAGASFTLSPRIDECTALLAEKEAEYDVLVDEYIDNLNDFLILNSSYNALTARERDYEELTILYEELLLENEYLNRSYFDLQNTLNLYGLNNYSRELIFVLNASHSGYDERTVTFDVGYGILMDVFVSLSKSAYESNIDIELSWRRDDRSGFLVGLGNAHAEGYDVVTVRAFCEIFDEKSDQMWVKSGAQIEELSWIEKSRLAAFSVP